MTNYNKMVSAKCLIWVMIILGTVMLQAGETTASNETSPNPSYTRCCPRSLTKTPSAFLKAYTTCQRKFFKSTGLKLQVCETSIYLSGKVPSLVFRKLGRLDKKAEEAISSMYHGVFQKQSSSLAMSNNRIAHDNDMCCPTDRHMVQAPERATSAHGHEFDVVFVTGSDGSKKYQFYQAGTCLPSSYHVGCVGTCVQMISTVYLVVFSQDPEELFGFEPFEIPAYCSCQNIGSSLARKGRQGERAMNVTEIVTTREERVSDTFGTLTGNRTMSDITNNTKSDRYNGSIPIVSNSTVPVAEHDVSNGNMSGVSIDTVQGVSNGTFPGESNRRRSVGARRIMSEISRVISGASNRKMADKFYRPMKEMSNRRPPAISHRNISDLAEGFSGLSKNSTSDLVNSTKQESLHGTES